MSFKISNTSFQESKRGIDFTTSLTEYISSSTDQMNPNIYLTKISATDVEYSVYLPNGTTGIQKMVTKATNGPDVTVHYNSGYDGGDRSITLYLLGDSIYFWATENGWHTRSWTD